MNKKEFIEKYGDIVVTFSHYYKYTFTYNAQLPDGNSIFVSFGGDASDIYKVNIPNNDKQKISYLDPYYGCVYKGDFEICSFYAR